MDQNVKWLHYITLTIFYIRRFVWYNLYYSQSAFNFLRHLHYHKSCSYQVHKGSSYRLFSRQEFKQNDSRPTCSSSSYYINFREKKVKEKERKKEVSVSNLGLKEEKT